MKSNFKVERSKFRQSFTIGQSFSCMSYLHFILYRAIINPAKDKIDSDLVNPCIIDTSITLHRYASPCLAFE
jgi:hypothetical protein